jgi:hypothetical protein
MLAVVDSARFGLVEKIVLSPGFGFLSRAMPRERRFSSELMFEMTISVHPSHGSAFPRLGNEAN